MLTLMVITDGAEKGDITLEKAGVKVFLERKASKLLSEAAMDFCEKRELL